MIYGNNVDANFEYLQRRMVEKALDALQAKHDELAELVAWYFECSDYYWHDDFLWQHGAPSVQGCAYDELTESYKAAEAALRKAVEG